MSVKVDITIDTSGLDRMLNNVDKAQELLTERVLEDDRGNVPVRTGHLRDSGHVAAKDTIEYTEYYSVYVYNGTRYMAANPWFERTKAANLGEWEQAVGDALIN